MADRGEERPRVLYEEGNPAHRVRVEHNRDTLLVHLSDEDGQGWTVMAVDRDSRRFAVAQARAALSFRRHDPSECTRHAAATGRVVLRTG